MDCLLLFDTSLLAVTASTIEHDFWHEGKHRKARSRARFLARGKAPKSTILCTKENTQNNARPKYKEICFLTVTAIRTDSNYCINHMKSLLIGDVSCCKKKEVRLGPLAPACRCPCWDTGPCSGLGVDSRLRCGYAGLTNKTMGEP